MIEDNGAEESPDSDKVNLHRSEKMRTRPPKVIDEEKLKEFLAVNMPITRIADYFSCSRQTLYNKFAELIVESNIDYEYKLRLAQHRLAVDGNPTMLIWLGKNVLGQVDSSHMNMNVETKPSVSEIRFTPLVRPDETEI